MKDQDEALTPAACALLSALRRCGIAKDADLRYAVHEASHALDAGMKPGTWSMGRISRAMKRLRPGDAARSEVVARAVEQRVCARVGVRTDGIEKWAGVSCMEAAKFREPFMSYAQCIEAVRRAMESSTVDARVREILALATEPCG